MDYKCLFVEKEGHIATVTINRPDAANSFDFRLMEEMDHVFRDNLDKDEDIRAIILTATGKYFSTGVDLNMFAAAEPEVSQDELDDGLGSSRVQMTDEEVPWGKGTIVGAVATMMSMGKPIVAAVNGPAVGLGFSVALACDIRIASDRSKFSAIFVKRGLAPDTGASFTLPRVVGFPKAKELLLTGDMVEPAEAERIGIVTKVVPHEELMTTATEVAVKLAKNPPLAVAIHKQALNQSMVETDVIAQMTHEIAYQDKMMATEDFQEAAKAFLEKREPVFKGR
jgi:2-(1,2-epoxy-1,2-dihydrophenyl)acetyl-CoA isomerase